MESDKPILSILIVDDIPDNLRLLTKILIDQGYYVHAVKTGREALSTVQSKLPALILLDIGLPDLTGYEVCKHLKADQLSKDIPVIFLSALDEIGDKLKGFEAGGVDYITKPFEAEEIIARVRTHIDIRLMRIALEQQATDLKLSNEKLQLEIIERKQAEEALFSEKELLSVTLCSIGDGVITVDSQGKVVIINKVAEELTGWTQNEAQGKPLAMVFNIINEITRKTCENPFEKVLLSGAIIELADHTILISRNGTERIISDSVAPISDRNKVTIGVVLVFRDITEKTKLLETSQKRQKLESLGVLAGGIAHDFNNLMGVVFGYIELANENSKDDKVTRYLSKAINMIDKLKVLTGQLRTFSTGGVPIREIENLFPVIQEFSLSSSNVSCLFDIQKNLWPCNIDKKQIGQVIDNMIVNAQQAMPMGGTVEVTAKNVSLREKEHPILDKGDYVKISIKNSGAGIPKEILPRIFDPFFTTREKGYGLGLSTSYSIINQHNGVIDVDTELDNGSTFHIYLPASPESGISTHAKLIL